MRVFALDHKVSPRLIRPLDFWPDAGVGGLQGIIRKLRPIAAHRLIKNLRAGGIHAVVDGIHPFRIGPKRACPARAGVKCQPSQSLIGTGYTRHEKGEGPDSEK